MIPRECKRLAEVDFPIADVSKHAAREKSIRHGHPSTLHLWWARRPLLGGGLQGDRRSVARGVNVIWKRQQQQQRRERQRGPERDFGPSR